MQTDKNRVIQSFMNDIVRYDYSQSPEELLGVLTKVERLFTDFKVSYHKEVTGKVSTTISGKIKARSGKLVDKTFSHSSDNDYKHFKKSLCATLYEVIAWWEKSTDIE